MKVYIGPYTNWFGPYQLAEKILFWMDKDKDERVFKFGAWLAGEKSSIDDDEWSMSRGDKGSKLYQFLRWVESKKKRQVKIRIDKYDTWNMDRTLAIIILPMLKQLALYKHGSPQVDNEDVPEHLRTTNTEDYDSQTTFDFYQESDLNNLPDLHVRWEWVLSEIIWTFEQLQPDCDWEDQYKSGTLDIRWKKTGKTFFNDITQREESVSEMIHGPNNTYKIDMEGMQKHQDRISNGLRLFGKYYQSLWD